MIKAAPLGWRAVGSLESSLQPRIGCKKGRKKKKKEWQEYNRVGLPTGCWEKWPEEEMTKTEAGREARWRAWLLNPYVEDVLLHHSVLFFFPKSANDDDTVVLSKYLCGIPPKKRPIPWNGHFSCLMSTPQKVCWGLPRRLVFVLLLGSFCNCVALLFCHHKSSALRPPLWFVVDTYSTRPRVRWVIVHIK